MDSLEHSTSKVYDMSRFDDGVVNIQELIHIMAEPIVSEIMDVQAEEHAPMATRETVTASARSPQASVPSNRECLSYSVEATSPRTCPFAIHGRTGL